MCNFVSVAARLPLVLRGIDGRPSAGDLGGLLHWLAITKNPPWFPSLVLNEKLSSYAFLVNLCFRTPNAYGRTFLNDGIRAGLHIQCETLRAVPDALRQMR